MTPREGFRHFQLNSYGGRGDERWVVLNAVLDESVTIKVLWTELKTYAKWTSGWLQLPKEEME